MKKFIIHTTIFCLLLGILFLILLSRANGYTDPFYMRFTTAQKSNLIIGTSRAAQALRPDVFEDSLGKTFFNYAFTLPHSPFGETYLNSIKKKLDKTVKNAVFIVTVDPWSISASGEDPNDSLQFQERRLCLGTTSFVNMNPNFEYLIENFRGKYYTFLKTKKSDTYLHSDGWLEVNYEVDSITNLNNILSKVAIQKNEKLPLYNFSRVRLKQLENTITYLKNYGRVYLVRLPVHDKMFLVDESLMPNFDNIISRAISLSDGYFDMTPLNADFKYTDGNHVKKESSSLVSALIAEWIKNNE